MSRFRTEAGGRVKRDKVLSFTFDGVAYQGLTGDTLASALLANGVHLVGRSFKYHRPRGIVTAGPEDQNALITLRRDAARETPNLRATQVELYQGLEAESQNRWPSLKFDVNAINGLASSLFVSGFYYKTFMWPRSFWKNVYEPRIRAAAGLGKAPAKADPDRYTSRYVHCDVLVIGAGPAGLTAALAAKEAGATVILADEGAEFGGSLLGDAVTTIEGKSTDAWMSDVVMNLAMSDKVRMLARTTAFGYFADNFVALVERVTDHLAAPSDALPRERLWQVRAKQVILATGALERPLVFPENDRPGIMMAEAGRSFLNRYGVKVGLRAVVFTATDSAYRAAIDLKQAGVDIQLIADLRARPPADVVDEALACGLTVRAASTLCGTQGGLRVSAAEVGEVNGDLTIGRKEVVDCDVVLMSGGWTPNINLHSQSRGRLIYNETTQNFLPGAPGYDNVSIGACKGTYDLSATMNEGYAAGEAAARASGRKGGMKKGFSSLGGLAMGGGHLGVVPHDRDPGRVKAFVDFQHDVTAKDIKLATREGFQSIEHVKRFTTTGMATDQGKTSNMNALAIAAKAIGKAIPEVGLTTFRLPYTPTTFGNFAGTARGDLFDPIRKTPMHDWAAAQGAPFENVALWKRAWYFPKAGEDMHAAVNRECKTVRTTVGMFDASTLGKIEVVGPDAAEFMNRMYVNPWTKLEIGRCRYGIMCRDDGFVYDDGVVGRMAADRFHVTTTTGGAPRVMNLMEDYLQTEFTDLKVFLTSTTEQWAVIAVQGPKAREVLAPLVEGIDIGKDAMPHMSVREGRICGVPTRLFRISFTGELGFEVNVPADYGQGVLDAIWREVREAGGCAYGTEAMHVLRAEKGYIIVGQDTDGTLTPDEAGVGWAVGKAKADFLGKRGLMRPDLTGPSRKQLIGLLTVDPKRVPDEGAQLVASAAPAKGSHALGHVTSAYWSENLGRSIAMAQLENGRARLGETVYITSLTGAAFPAVVADPIFYDKAGARIDV
ncbi:MAG: sarcosine oxidase subunit alpha family protein [Hyphomicrobiaceae bacterium]|nr:sarcosine oxidase subunit alpha family protein [Hyphomicrobiaceae bacterium]